MVLTTPIHGTEDITSVVLLFIWLEFGSKYTSFVFLVYVTKLMS